MLWILLGVLAVLFVRNHYDVQGVKKDLRGIARGLRKMIQELAEAIRHGIDEAKKEKGHDPGDRCERGEDPGAGSAGSGAGAG